MALPIGGNTAKNANKIRAGVVSTFRASRSPHMNRLPQGSGESSPRSLDSAGLDLDKEFGKLGYMKKSFLVQSFGYWGRAETIAKAAAKCISQGANKTDLCYVDLFVHPDKDPEPAICSGGMAVEYVQGSEKIRIAKGIKLSTASKFEE